MRQYSSTPLSTPMPLAALVGVALMNWQSESIRLTL
jgi:hypothetical protein